MAAWNSDTGDIHWQVAHNQAAVAAQAAQPLRNQRTLPKRTAQSVSNCRLLEPLALH